MSWSRTFDVFMSLGKEALLMVAYFLNYSRMFPLPP